MEEISLPELSRRLEQNIASVIMGKNEIIEKVVLSILCGGHVLLEDIPSTGKTTSGFPPCAVYSRSASL